MFEAILTLCLLAEPAACRDVLLPGYQTKSLKACERRLGQAQVDWKQRFKGYEQRGKSGCRPIGKIAKFVEVADGVFAHRGIISDAAADNLGDVSNAGFVIGDTSIAVIDSSGSRKVAEQIYRAIRSHSTLPISHLILTHMHPDHVFGASVFADAGAKVVGHTGLRRALQDRAEAYLGNFGGLIGKAEFIGTQIVYPDVAVEEFREIDLGNRKLKVQVWDNSHTNTDITVHDIQSGVLFTGDLVFHEHAPALDGSLKGWRQVLNQMSKMNIEMIVPGHGGPFLPWPSSSKALANYLEVLETDTRKAIDAGTRLGEAVKTIAESERDNWQLFDLFNPRNATVAYTELEWE